MRVVVAASRDVDSPDLLHVDQLTKTKDKREVSHVD
jgi:hypothetical protein